MNLADPDQQPTRFRRPPGVAVMAYKTILGPSEIVVGLLLAVPSFDPQATFARLSAEELRARTPVTASWLWSAGICRRCCTIAGWSRSG
jgi:hypothetical protein